MPDRCQRNTYKRVFERSLFKCNGDAMYNKGIILEDEMYTEKELTQDAALTCRSYACSSSSRRFARCEAEEDIISRRVLTKSMT